MVSVVQRNNVICTYSVRVCTAEKNTASEWLPTDSDDATSAAFCKHYYSAQFVYSLDRTYNMHYIILNTYNILYSHLISGHDVHGHQIYKFNIINDKIL